MKSEESVPPSVCADTSSLPLTHTHTCERMHLDSFWQETKLDLSSNEQQRQRSACLQLHLSVKQDAFLALRWSRNTLVTNLLKVEEKRD